MDKRHRTKRQKDLKRCTRLYEGFSDASPFFSAMYECVQTFFVKRPVNPGPSFDLKEVEDSLRSGISLQVDVPLDTQDVVDLLKSIGVVLAEANPELKGPAGVLREYAEQLAMDSSERICKQNVRDLCDRLVTDGDWEQDLATLLYNMTLSSFYKRCLQETSESLRTGLWSEGHCPLCGEKPHYGVLRADDGAKELQCWLCGTSWVHTRIKCPYCGNEEQEDLGYFTLEGQEACRVNFCQKCRQYCKIIDGRKLKGGGEVFLDIHNLASLSYDLVARQEGFTPGSGLQWVNAGEMACRQGDIDKTAN
ncbi:MAG: formate dehydrogenase accessory protein FdhE [Dehalococcoidia bacterium]